MNLSKLFEKQRILDEVINKKHRLEGQDLLPKKILALQVELGELAQNWRGFKYWSVDQEPRTKVWRDSINHMRGKGGYYENPLLEEYVDCLHFILSIGLELKLSNFEYSSVLRYVDNVTIQFINIQRTIINLWNEEDYYAYATLLGYFLALGETLGFTWKQIEQAYLEKNKVNHERLANGY